MALRARRTLKAIAERLEARLPTAVVEPVPALPPTLPPTVRQSGWYSHIVKDRASPPGTPVSPDWLLTPEMTEMHAQAILWDIRVTPNPYEEAYDEARAAMIAGTATDDQKALVDDVEFKSAQAEADHWEDYNLRRWGHRRGPRGGPE
jgi:hypothetical protein